MGDYDRAYGINLRDNVFPGVVGRVCARPCEAACRHGWEGLGEPVAICWSKRSAADSSDQALTTLNQGIPEFGLPRDAVAREIEQVRRQGVEIRCGVQVGSTLQLSELAADFDAVVLAAGTLRPTLLGLPGTELDGIYHGLEFLLRVNEGEAVDVGRDVLVIGGGFTAMDCARTAARLGATTQSVEPHADGGYRLRGDDVRVLYRRSQAEMLVTPGEVEELQREGIRMDFMVAPVAFVAEGNGRS